MIDQGDATPEQKEALREMGRVFDSSPDFRWTTFCETLQHMQEHGYHNEEVLEELYHRVREVDYETRPITKEGRTP